MNRDNGLLYMLAFCLLLALVMLLQRTPPTPPKVATVSKDDFQTQQERNARASK